MSVIVERSGPLWRITLARPEKANALTGEMLGAIAQAARAAQGQARAVVITGQGKVFSAGADLDEVAEGLATDPAWQEASAAIADLPCLSIAALNGTVAGGALGLALACDVRLAVPEAKAFYPVLARGLLPPHADPIRLLELVGPSRASMILSAGQKVSATEALTWGLFDRIVPAEALLSEAEAFCADAVAADPAHAAAIKAMIRE